MNIRDLNDIDNIFIFNLVNILPVKYILLLKESCKFFNDISKKNIDLVRTVNFFSNLKKKLPNQSNSISTGIKNKRLRDRYYGIKIYNILIGQIKLFNLILSEIPEVHKLIKFMVKYGNIDFECYSIEIRNECRCELQLYESLARRSG